MQPSTAFTNADLPEPPPSSGAKDTLAIIAIIIILAGLLIGGAYLWKRSHTTTVTNTNTVATSTQTNAASSTNTLVVIQPPATTTIANPLADSQWLNQSYSLGKHDFNFQIPSGYHSRTDGRSKIEIVPDNTAANFNPDPVMTIKLVENLELAKVMDAEAKTAPTGNLEWHDVDVNGLYGKALKVDNKAYPEVDLIYTLKSDVDAFVFRPFEDALWDPFDRVVHSFKETITDRKG